MTGKNMSQPIRTTYLKGSSLRQYQEVFVGSYGFWKFLKYESITSLFGLLPGATGLLLRKIFYRCLFKGCGHNVILGRNITLRYPGRIELGDGVVVEDNCVLDAKGKSDSGIKFGDNVIVGRNTILSTKDGFILIGNNTNIGSNCRLGSTSKLVIGENVLVGAYSYFSAGGEHRFDRVDIPIMYQGTTSKGITIGDNVWVGAAVKVLDGVTIGRDSVIGAGAVVTKDIPQFVIACGVPAKVIKDRKNRDQD